MIKLLIIGFGSIAKKHIDALKKMNIDFTAYALRSNKNAPVINGIKNIFDLDEIDFKIDFAIISNPTNLHYQYIDILANKNIPIFIEKPPLSTLNGANELASKIKEHQLKTYVACNLRFHPCIAYVKAYLSNHTEKRINEVNVYCGSYLPDWRPGQNYKEVYSANATMGGGVHLDLFHEIDYVHWFFDQPIKVDRTFRSSSSLNIDAYDYANYVLTYKDFAVSIILNYYRRDPKRNIEIVFEKETWTIDLLLNRITNGLGDVVYEEKNFLFGDTYSKQMQYFLNYLTDNQLSMNTFEESLETLKICLLDE